MCDDNHNTSASVGVSALLFFSAMCNVLFVCQKMTKNKLPYLSAPLVEEQLDTTCESDEHSEVQPDAHDSEPAVIQYFEDGITVVHT